METSSPPATPMLLLKTDLKHQQNNTQESMSKRPRILMIDPSTSVIPTTTSIIDRLNPQPMTNSHWQTHNLKTYEGSPGSFCFLFVF